MFTLKKMNILLTILSNFRFLKIVLSFLVEKKGRCKKNKKQLLTSKTMHLLSTIIRTVLGVMGHLPILMCFKDHSNQILQLF